MQLYAVVVEKSEFTRKADGRPGVVLTLLASQDAHLGTLKAFLSPSQVVSSQKDKTLFSPGSSVLVQAEQRVNGFSTYLYSSSVEPVAARATLTFA